MTAATVAPIGKAGDEAAPAADPDDRARSFVDRLRRVPLWGHLLAFALLLACVAPFVHAGPAFTTDEGAYGLQQRTIHDTGSFAFDWKGRGVDPPYRWYPIVNGSVAERGAFPYVAHPAYPLLLRASTAVAGETVGLLLVPLIGALVAAAAAWWLAEEVDPRLAPLAFWLAALGPLFVNAWIIWAHAPGAALAGLSLVAALRAGRRGMRSMAFGGAVLATIAGSLLRSENLIFAVGAALAFVIVRRMRVSTVRAAAESAVLVVAAAGTAFCEARWRSSIIGAQDAVSGIRQTDGSFLTGRLSGMYHSLLLPDAGWHFDLLVIALSAVLAALVVMTCRSRSSADPRRLATGVTALASAGLLAVIVAESPTRSISGLVAAWPVVLLAGGALVGTTNRSTRALVAATAVLVAGVLATQYAEGGGLEWGGRF